MADRLKGNAGTGAEIVEFLRIGGKEGHSVVKASDADPSIGSAPGGITVSEPGCLGVAGCAVP